MPAQIIMFQRTYGCSAGAGTDWGYSVQQTTDNGYILAGVSDGFSSSDDILLVKTDSFGDTLWTKILGSPVTSEAAFSVKQTYDGGYVLVGGYLNGGYNDVYLLKTNSNGNLQWTKVYINPNKNEGGSAVKQTSDGGFIIVGANSDNSTNIYLLKTDSNGDTLWTKSYGGTNYEVGNDVQETFDKGYIITGVSYNLQPDGNDVYLIKTNSNGDTLWTKTYGGTKNDQGISVQQTFDGNYIIVGYTESFSSYREVYLIKTDSNGDTLWTKVISNPNSVWAKGFCIDETADKGFIISGGINIGAQLVDAYLIKTNSSGDTLWTRIYGGIGSDWSTSVQQTTDKGYILLGSSDSYDNYQHYYLVKTDSLGNTSPLVGVFEQQEAAAVAGEITIYPNPFATQANLVLPNEINTNGEAELVIYNITGNETARVKITAQRALIERENLSAGMYFCKVIKENTVIATGKFIIQ